MPYKTGSWGKQEKERSRRRLGYFNKYSGVKDPGRNKRLVGMTDEERKNHFLAYKRNYRKNQKKRIMEKLGGKCVNCGFDDLRALQIDHVNGGGYRELKSMSYTRYLNMVLKDNSGKYQILCANCNWIKRRGDKYDG